MDMSHQVLYVNEVLSNFIVFSSNLNVRDFLDIQYKLSILETLENLILPFFLSKFRLWGVAGVYGAIKCLVVSTLYIHVITRYT